MNMQAQVLSFEEKRLIHEESMRILEEVGILFPSERALDILETGGARIDRDKKVAFISREMVARAIACAPKEFELSSRTGTHDLKIPSMFIGYHLDGCGMTMVDFETGERRPSALKDLADAARVFDEMDRGYIYWPPVSPLDIPSEARSIAATATGFMNTSKHIQDEMKTSKEIPYILELIKATLGCDKLSSGKDIYSVVYCTVSPLCHDGEMLEANIELCKYKIPIVALPMPATTTTGPASLYSNVALSNAEALSAFVMFQLTEPGVPMFYASSLGVANPRNGQFLFGMPETVIQLMATVEMGKYYGLPTTIAGMATDAKGFGGQTMFEKAVTSLPLILSRPDTLVGFGMFECSTVLSLSQIVVDNEVARYCERMAQGMRVESETDFFADIKQVGHGGHFLKQKNTRAAVRSSEFFSSELFDKSAYGEWVSLGSKDLDQAAAQVVREILGREQSNPLPDDSNKLIKEIVSEACAKLSD
jgi:trimethylamine---corrinoid protein Co-methyltransferase